MSTLFEALRPRLTAISSRIVGSTAEAEDIVQDCFLKWHGADQSAVATPIAWLTTVVQHQSIDRLRKRARDAAAAQAALDLAPLAPPSLPEADLLMRAELAEGLGRLLRQLSAFERLTLVLHDVFECSHADIAAALGTTALNARQYLARARRRLREVNEATLDDKLCRERIRRFQDAINGRDMPAMMALLTDEQPVRMRASANDAVYCLAA